MKLTHEEARNVCDDMELELEESMLLTTYFEQQEKVTKLLELYQDYKSLQEAKEFHRNKYASLKMNGKNYREDQAIYHHCLQDIITKSNQIKELEEEMK